MFKKKIYIKHPPQYLIDHYFKKRVLKKLLFCIPGVLFILVIFALHKNFLSIPLAQADTLTTSVLPSADSYVNSSVPTSNFGTSTTLVTDTSPERIIYMKFDLSSLSGMTLSGATLRIHTSTGAGDGTAKTQSVNVVEDTTWTETGIIYNNKPATSTLLGSLTSATNSASIDIPLSTSAIQTKVGGNFALAITSGGADLFRIYSKETVTSSTDKPQLLLTYSTIPPSPTPTPIPGSCSYTIPTSTTIVDGDDNYSSVQPGDTLCIPAGVRDNIKFYNLHGTANNPITIRNDGGVAKITGTTYSTGGIALYDSSYLHITGTNTSSKCGSQYSPAQQECGIEIYNAYKGISNPNTDVNYVEIDHVSIHNIIQNGSAGPGFSIHPGNGHTLSGLYIHHNYVNDTYTEGIYLGSDPNKPIEENGTLDDIEVSYNYVANTGFDAINLKQTTNMKVHHNIALTSGTLNGFVNHVPEGGLQFAASEGEVYNNFVKDSRDTGIHMGRVLTTSNTKYYNNIVIGTSAESISTPETNPVIYNNTIIGGTYGVDASTNTAQIFDNIIAGYSVAAFTNGTRSATNNYTGSTDSVNFRNPNSDDYHLTANSLVAIDKGRNTGTFPSIDYDGVSRPQGTLTDFGAFEYTATASTNGSSSSTSSVSSSSTANPNIHEGWKYPVQAGPNYVGLAYFIAGGKDAEQAKTFISHQAHHDDVHISIQKKLPDELLQMNPPIAFPWTQGFNTAGEIYEFKAYSAFNGYEIQEFDNPVTIVLPYTLTPGTQISEKQLQIAYFDIATQKWKTLPNVVLNSSEHTLATTTKKFSMFTVVYRQ